MTIREKVVQFGMDVRFVEFLEEQGVEVDRELVTEEDWKWAVGEILKAKKRLDALSC